MAIPIVWEKLQIDYLSFFRFRMVCFSPTEEIDL